MLVFTFYYIYINTLFEENNYNVYTAFTFYYIYINTSHFLFVLASSCHLHSTIFILILHFSYSLKGPTSFTFYYIYINTLYLRLQKILAILFTFYYIYINTHFNFLPPKLVGLFTFYYIYINTIPYMVSIMSSSIYILLYLY